MRVKVAKWLLAKARGIANEADHELIVDIGKHDFELDFVEPDSNEERHWDDLYQRGNIYLKNHANPIKPDPDDADSIITTDRWKQFLDQNAYADAFDTIEDTGPDMTDIILLAVLAVQVGMFAYLYMG